MQSTTMFHVALKLSVVRLYFIVGLVMSVNSVSSCGHRHVGIINHTGGQMGLVMSQPDMHVGVKISVGLDTNNGHR